ncbi:MAG: hypothetical protein GY694_15895, partial [Gammaproteobacteria bacterium]|nr:hypothetical protein [Gammaproteobacteria bacterium]
IDEKLFDEAIDFARGYVPISKDKIDIMKNARNSLLFHNDKTWTKTNTLFDVTMGAYDGAEVCELVGLLILSKMKTKFPEINFGLYRDDGLGAQKVTRKAKMEQKKKAITKMFRDLGLEITIDTNMNVVNFLDATLSMKDGKFWPYSKPNSNTKYVHTKSSHPQHVLKQIPNSINTRLSEISCDEEQFDRAKGPYEKALKESGHEANLQYREETGTGRCRKRNRNVIWYNPPFNINVKTNFGKKFLEILDSNFPKQHYLHKYLNRRTVKISYSCTKNMASIIATHNKGILQTPKTDEKTCNCRKKAQCPLNGNCRVESVIYKAKIVAGNNVEKNYIGSTENEFKTRYNGHTDSFRNEAKKHSTALSTLVWEQKQNPTPKIEWSVVKRTNRYRPGSKMCDLCVTEKLYILNAAGDKNNLNKRNEIASLCVHRNKYKLNNVK